MGNLRYELVNKKPELSKKESVLLLKVCRVAFVRMIMISLNM